MGAYYFDHHVVTTDEAQDVFDDLVKQAGWDFGHAGYTGTIAEKSDFIYIRMPGKVDVLPTAEQALQYLAANDDDPRISDKWGPAGCIRTDDGYVFFGWASS